MWPNSTLNGLPSRIWNGEFKKLKKICGTTRASVARLTVRYKDTLHENYVDQEDGLMAILETLKDKQSDLKKINRDKIELSAEDELKNEITQHDEIDINIRLVIQKNLK